MYRVPRFRPFSLQSLPYMIDCVAAKFEKKKKSSNIEDPPDYLSFSRMWKGIKALLFSRNTNKQENYLRSRKMSKVSVRFNSKGSLQKDMPIRNSKFSKVLDSNSTNSSKKFGSATFENTILYDYLNHHFHKDQVQILIAKILQVMKQHSMLTQEMKAEIKSMFDFLLFFF